MAPWEGRSRTSADRGREALAAFLGGLGSGLQVPACSGTGITEGTGRPASRSLHSGCRARRPQPFSLLPDTCHHEPWIWGPRVGGSREACLPCLTQCEPGTLRAGAGPQGASVSSEAFAPRPPEFQDRKKCRENRRYPATRGPCCQGFGLFPFCIVSAFFVLEIMLQQIQFWVLCFFFFFSFT